MPTSWRRAEWRAAIHFDSLRTVLVALVLVAASSAQSLPDHHLRSADILPSGDHVVRGLFARSATSFIRYTVGFDNIGEKRVIILWEGAYLTDGSVDYSRRDSVWQTEGTSFRPLAVAAEGGLSSVLHVVGWYDRTGELVIERWSMGRAVLGQAAATTGSPTVTLSPPPLDKHEIYRGAFTGPAYDAVFHPQTRELLLLADVDVSVPVAKSFYALEVDARDPRPVARPEMAIALLADARGLKLGVTDDGAVYLSVLDVPKWGEYAGGEFGNPPASNRIHVFCDAGGDGDFEVSFEDDAATVLDLSADLPWDVDYVAADPP